MGLKSSLWGHSDLIPRLSSTPAITLVIKLLLNLPDYIFFWGGMGGGGELVYVDDRPICKDELELVALVELVNEHTWNRHSKVNKMNTEAS